MNIISTVTVDFSAFGGGTAVSASNSSDTWTASYTIVAGSIDTTNLNVSITSTDNAGNATAVADSTNATVDNVVPTVTDSNISISGASGTGGAYKVGDTLTVTWDNTASGDSNADTISMVTVDFTTFGGDSSASATESSGTWTATLTITEDGGGTIESSNLNVSVTATDNTGNTITTADTSDAVLDNHTPAAPADLDLLGSSDSGSSNTDNLTNDNTPTISGTAEANSTVEVFDAGSTSLGTATAENGGNWAFTAGALSDGAHDITAKATDSAGNTSSASSALFITVDTGAPAISGISDQMINEDSSTGAVAFTVSDALAAAANLTVASASSDTTLLPLSSISLSGTGPNRTATATPQPDLNGVVTITLSITDPAGNSSNKAVRLTVNPVNDVPSFVKGADQTVLEDSGAQTVPNWATSLSVGPGNESSQTLTFQLSNDSNGLFSAQPAIASNGTLTFTPAADANGSATVTVALKDDGGSANGGVDTSSAQMFTISVTAVNDTPSFVKGADQTILEDAGAQTISGWATGISAGPADESGQTLAFQVTNDNNALFLDQPSITSNGTLTYTPADHANGSALVSVALTDDGGTENGGSDTSASQTFTISVTLVNDAPTLGPITDQSILEDSGPQSIALGGISAGPENEAQTISITAASDNPAVIPNPTVEYSSPNATGLLRYTPAANGNGTATITVTVTDDAGVGGGGIDTTSRSFAVTVSPVNDSPSFTKGVDQTVLEDAGDQTVNGWAAGISRGPNDESGQALDFQVSNNNNELFSSQPSIDPDGTLSYTPTRDRNGSATVTVRLKDDGGTAQGGTDLSAEETFVITVTPVNDAPALGVLSDLTVPEDSEEVAVILSGIGTGGWSENQQLHVSGNSSDATRVLQPRVDFSTFGGAATLRFRPVPNAHGSVTMFVTVTDDGGTADGGVDRTTASFQLNIVPVNDPPHLTQAGPLAGATEDNPFTISFDDLVGASDASDIDGDAVSFRIEAVHAGSLKKGDGSIVSGATLFGPGESLVWIPPADANGVLDAFSIRATDGNLNSDHDVAVKIAVAPVNDSPALEPLADRTVGEDTPVVLSVTMSDVETSIQELGLSVQSSNPTLLPESAVLFSRSNGSGSLALVPAADQNGTATITVTATDEDGLSVSEAFLFTVNPVNDPPSFAIGADQAVEEDAGEQFVENWATHIQAGPVDEAGQRVVFATDTDNPALFAQLPFVGPDGTLSYTTFTNAFGEATVSVRLEDDGGSANGGMNVSAIETFSIVVAPVNDLPHLSLVRPLEGATNGVPLIIDYVTLAGASDATDADGDLIHFQLDEVLNGTLVQNGAELTPGASMLGPDESWIWIPAAHGIVDAFRVGAFDGLEKSVTNAPVKVSVKSQKQFKLVASDAAADDFFGYPVSISGETVVAGAYRANVNGEPARGAAYVYQLGREQTNWVEHAKLTADDGLAGDWFGYSVAISGDVLVVGASQARVEDKDLAGAAYVYMRDGTNWVQQTKLSATIPAELSRFGSAVAVDSQTIVVGARQATVSGKELSGAAYVFVRQGTDWVQQARLEAEDARAGDWFGSSVSVSGDTLIVGAFLADLPDRPDAGAAYVFTRSGTNWIQQAKLTASDGFEDDHFGAAVALSEDTIAVGSFLADVSGRADAGAVYAYSLRDGVWLEDVKLTARGSHEMDWFGASVALEDETLVVGASQADVLEERNGGAVFVYTRDAEGWSEPTKWVANDAATDSRFGTAVAVSGRFSAVGSFLAEVDGDAHAGAAYVLTLREQEPNSEDALNSEIDPGDAISVASIREGPLPAIWRPDSEPALRLFSPAFSPEGGVRVLLSAPLGKNVQLQVSEDMVHWTVIQNATIDSPIFEFFDAQVEFAPNKFYRLVPTSSFRQ